MSDLERRLVDAGRVLDRASATHQRAEVATDLPPRNVGRGRRLPALAAAAAVIALALGGLVAVTHNRGVNGSAAPATTSVTEPAVEVTAVAPTTEQPTLATEAPGTLPPRIMDTSPATSAAPSAPTTSDGRAPGGALIAVATTKPSPAVALDPDNPRTWPVIGSFPGDDTVEVVGMSTQERVMPTCLGLRPTSANAETKRTCYGTGVFLLGNRLAVLSISDKQDALTLDTTSGSVTVPSFAFRSAVPGGPLWVASALLPDRVDLHGTTKTGQSDCLYRPVLAAMHDHLTIGGLWCADDTVEVAHGLDVPQPDSAYLDKVDGRWALITNGGDPCLDADSPPLDSTNSNLEQAQIDAWNELLSRLKAACQALAASH